jgi:rare lipoprotein A
VDDPERHLGSPFRLTASLKAEAEKALRVIVVDPQRLPFVSGSAMRCTETTVNGKGISPCPGTKLHDFALSICFSFVCEAVMLSFSRIVAIATVPAWLTIHVDPAAAQTFDERWSIIPKAHAEPPPEAPGPTKQDPQTQPALGAELAPGSEDRSVSRSFNRVFSGTASYYSYSAGKTASGSSFDRNLLTAAHRSLPFGTRVRVTDLATSKSVVVRITDRGPKVRGRVLDLSLSAARNLGITDRGLARVRAEVL